MTCKHTAGAWWRLATNEDGWYCQSCREKMPGEPPGFRPDLDRSEIREKVSSILMEMHEAKLVYMSNSDHGESIAGLVTKTCNEHLSFDQYSIIEFIMIELRGHGRYWTGISEAVLAGKDQRSRCHCGKLANHWSDGKHTCSEH